MGRKIIYIFNPVAGTRSKKGLLSLIEEKTKEAGIPFQIINSEANGDYSFLFPLLRENGITDIVIAGGDGTISQVVQSLGAFPVSFGIIPCGSGNGLAFTAGIPKSADKALNIIFTGNAIPIDGFYINDRFACMLCGLGFDAKVAHDFAHQKKRGLSMYIQQVVRNFFSARTYAFDILVGEQSFSRHAYFISIANSNQFGNNFTIAPNASLDDGLLDIVIVTRQNKLSLIVQTLRQVRGMNKLLSVSRLEVKKGVLYFQAPELIIKNRSGAPLHIDGDPAGSPEELTIRISPNHFRLIQPRLLLQN